MNIEQQLSQLLSEGKTTELNWDRQNLESLPAGLTKLSTLRQLNLEANKLQGLPDDFANLNNLDIVDAIVDAALAAKWRNLALWVGVA